MDTPFSVTNYTSKYMEDKQTRSIAEVFADDPSVRSTGAPGGYIDYFFIRGFEVANGDVTYNGLPGILPHEVVSTNFLDRVEILNGPAGLLYGISPSGAIGGAINAVAKRATDDPITRLTATYGSNAEFGTHLDYGRRFGDNKEWGVRFNGTVQGGDKTVDNNSQRLGNAVLGVDYRGERLRFSVDGGYSDRRINGFYDTIDFLSSDFKVPSPPSGTLNAFPSWTRAESQDVFGMVRAEYDIASNWTVFGAIGARQNKLKLLGAIELLNDSAGDFLAFPRVGAFSNNAESGQVGIRGNFDTGPINHQVAFSANFAEYRSGFMQNILASQTGNLSNANALAEPDVGNFSYPTPLSSVTDNASYAVADTLSILDKRVALTLGARSQEIQSTNYDTTTGAQTSSYDKSVVTPAVGLVVKPLQNVSLYANYIEGLQQGVTVPSIYANAGQVLPPYISKQVETGVKVDWGTFTTTADVFRITQPATFVDTVTNIFSSGGEQRNQGFEFKFFGVVTPGVRLLGGVALIDGRLTKTSSPLTQGNRPYGVPDVQANLGAEWDTPFVRNLTLTGRVIYTSSQFVNQLNTQSIPEWTRVDLGARYVWERPGAKPVTFRADVINVANRSYWAAYSFSTSLVQSQPAHSCFRPLWTSELCLLPTLTLLSGSLKYPVRTGRGYGPALSCEVAA